MNLQKIHETMVELEHKIGPNNAAALRLLRQREDDLRTAKIVTVAEAAKCKDKKKEQKKKHTHFDSDSENSNDRKSTLTTVQ